MAERSFSEVLQDIVHHVQEIVRSEVRLARVEIQEEAAKTKASMTLLGAGAVAALFAVLFLLYTVADLLALVLPGWAAALIVGGVLAIAAGVTLSAGAKEFRRIHPKPERTAETIKENIEWARQQTK